MERVIWLDANKTKLIVAWLKLPELVNDLPQEMTIAERATPGHSWGPPITLTLQKD